MKTKTIDFSKDLRGFKLVPKEYRKLPELSITMPKRGTQSSAGYDFTLPIDVSIGAHSSVFIPTDICAYMQPNEVLQVYVRSSIGIKKGLMLSNTVGIIDADYYGNPDNGGNIGICLHNYTNSPVVLAAGERVVQGIFTPFLTASNGNTDAKRTGGTGSTNK